MLPVLGEGLYAAIASRLSSGRARMDVLTRKSTPIVALDSSSGSHCSSENLSNRLLFPTDEFPMRSNLTLIGAFALSCDCAIG